MARRKTPRGRVTATDIARHLGLSVTSVSFVLNDSPHINKVSQGNRERIRQLAREWNYIPNLVAKSLREKKANVVGVLFADLRFGWAHAALLGMQEVFEPAGIVPLIAISMWDEQREQRDLRSMVGRQVDGIILVAPNVENVETYRSITATGVPLLFMGDALRDHDEFSRVLWDEADAIATATEQLITAGRKRLVMLSSDYNSLTQEMRHTAFLKKLSEHGLGSSPDKILRPPRGQSPAEALEAYFASVKEPANGLVATNDALAFAALAYCDRHGVRVPDDLAIIGVGDFEYASHRRMSLSTVQLDRHQLGRRAAEVLTGLIDNRPKAPVHETLERGPVMLRSST